jgi:hypothetical protein
MAAAAVAAALDTTEQEGDESFPELMNQLQSFDASVLFPLHDCATCSVVKSEILERIKSDCEGAVWIEWFVHQISDGKQLGARPCTDIQYARFLVQHLLVACKWTALATLVPHVVTLLENTIAPRLVALQKAAASSVATVASEDDEEEDDDDDDHEDVEDRDNYVLDAAIVSLVLVLWDACALSSVASASAIGDTLVERIPQIGAFVQAVLAVHRHDPVSQCFALALVSRVCTDAASDECADDAMCRTASAASSSPASASSTAWSVHILRSTDAPPLVVAAKQMACARLRTAFSLDAIVALIGAPSSLSTFGPYVHACLDLLNDLHRASHLSAAQRRQIECALSASGGDDEDSTISAIVARLLLDGVNGGNCEPFWFLLSRVNDAASPLVAWVVGLTWTPLAVAQLFRTSVAHAITWTPMVGFITRFWRARAPHLFTDTVFVSQLADVLLHASVSGIRCTQSALALLVRLLVATDSVSPAWVSPVTIALACDRVTDVLSILLGKIQVKMECWHTSAQQFEAGAVAVLCDWSAFLQWCLAASPATESRFTVDQRRRIQFLSSLVTSLPQPM